MLPVTPVSQISKQGSEKETVELRRTHVCLLLKTVGISRKVSMGWGWEHPESRVLRRQKPSRDQKKSRLGGGWAGGRQQREALEKRRRASVIQLLSLQPLQARQQELREGKGP